MARPEFTLAQVAQKVRPVTLARDQTLAVPTSLSTLLPDGLPRGSVVAVGAAPGVTGATTMALALAAGPSQSGAWVAVVGLRSLGLLAATGLGVVSERLALVAAPERRGALASVAATLVDGFDVVVVGPEVRRRLHGGDTRRLMARIRERGGVLLAVGDDLPGGSAQVRLRVVASRWEGVEQGAGHLQQRRATVELSGRGAASRLRRVELLLPGDSGAAVVPAVVPPSFCDRDVAPVRDIQITEAKAG